MRYDEVMPIVSLSSLSRWRHLAAVGLMLSVVYACGSDDRRGSSGSGIAVASAVGSGSGSGSGAGGSTSTSGAGLGGADTGPTPPEKFLPTPTGDCPAFESGKVSFNFGGAEPRDAEVWTSSDATGGPLVFVWHSFDGSPLDAIDILGQDVIDTVKAQGGAVVAPYADPNAGFASWHYILGSFMDDSDLRVVDEIVACAIEKKGISTRRIHSVGFGFGAMQTAQLAVWRSGYVASIVAHSVSLAGNPMEQDPDNLYAAMVLNGGPEDANMFQFNVDSPKYVDMLRGDEESAISGEHFVVSCAHEGGHVVAEDSRDSAYEFLLAHPYSTAPSPYEGGLPDDFPSFCEVAE